MAHRIEFSPSAARQLKKLDRALRPALAKKLDVLTEQPRPNGCEKLSGYEDLYRVRVGDYRIVYGISDRLLLVLVLKVGNRAEVYERIRKADLYFLRQVLKEAED